MKTMETGLVSPAANLPTTRTLPELEADILSRKRLIGANIVAIGQALIEAKAQLQHGEWGTWLREKVEFSQSSANNFMAVAREVSADSPIARLPYTKVMALLEVPKEEREAFAEENHVEDKSAAEIRRLIKEKEEAERRITRLESTNQLQVEKLQEKRQELQAAQEAAGAAEEQIAKLQDKLKRREGDRDSLHKQVLGLIEENEKLRNQEPTIIREVPEDYEQLKKKLAAAEDEADRLADELDQMKLNSVKKESDNVSGRILSAIGGMMAMCGRDPALLTTNPGKMTRSDWNIVMDKVSVVRAWCDAMEAAAAGR